MSTDTATKRPEETSEQLSGDDAQRGLGPLLLAALMARREESGGGIHPLLIAALTAKHGPGTPAPPIDPLLIAALAPRLGPPPPPPPIDPLLLVALLSQRSSAGEPGIAPMVLMPMVLKAFAGRGQGREEAFSPLVLAALAQAR
jgi:hypothetical protein